MDTMTQPKELYGLNSREYNDLIDSVKSQHTKDGLNDFAHQSITTATHLYSSLRLANLIGIYNAPKNKNISPDQRLTKTLNKIANSHGYTDELAGWRGDITGEALKKPILGNEDYKADLDAVNITSLMERKGLDYVNASNQYYSHLAKEEYTRASEFLKNIGGEDYIKQELLDAEQATSLEELQQKNKTAYDFYKSLIANNGLGSNNLIEDVE